MAISQQAIQNVEFLELRRVFKEELNDLEKVNKQILDVLKDNNDILKDFVDKIQLTSITKGLGKAFSPKKEKEEDTELKPDVIKSFGNIKDFVTGFGKRIEEYKEFFFDKKPISKNEDVSQAEEIPRPKFVGKGESQLINPSPLLLEAPKKKQYEDVIDVTPVKSKTPLLEAPKGLLTPSIAKTTDQTASKTSEDISGMKKAMLGDGIAVKIMNPEEIKTEPQGGGGGGGVIDLLSNLSGGAGKGGKLGGLLGMAGKAAKVLGPAAAIAGAAYSGFEGYQNTASNFELKEGEEATLGQKVSSTLGGIASGATFGLLSEKNAAQGIQRAGEFVGDKVSAAYSGVKGFFGGIGDNVKNAFTKGIDEKKGVTQADQLVSSYTSSTDSEESSAGGVLNKSSLTEGITSQKTVLGSTFLGGLFSKKGTTTGEFLGQSSNQSLLEANQDVGEHGNVTNLNKFDNKLLFGKRTATGLFGSDKYEVTDEKDEKTELTKGQYGKIQKLISSGKVEDANKELQSIKDKRALNQEMSNLYGSSPEDTVTPMTEPFSTSKVKVADKESGNFFGNIGRKIKDAFTKGIDEKKGVTQADTAISSYIDSSDSSESSASGVLNKSSLTEGITSEKTVLGSTFLGKLFSKKGTTTGQFMGQSTNQSLLEANQDVGEHGNVTNLNKISSSTLLGERKAGGILSKDKYSIYSDSDGKEETTDLTRTEYNKIQKQVKAGKVDEAQSTLQKIKDKREIDKQNAQIYGRTPEDMVTPITEMSRTNEELKRKSSAPINLPPVVSNTVQTNNTQTLSPIKAQPRSSMNSALERYLDRTTAYA